MVKNLYVNIYIRRKNKSSSLIVGFYNSKSNVNAYLKMSPRIIIFIYKSYYSSGSDCLQTDNNGTSVPIGILGTAGNSPASVSMLSAIVIFV